MSAPFVIDHLDPWGDGGTLTREEYYRQRAAPALPTPTRATPVLGQRRCLRCGEPLPLSEPDHRPDRPVSTRRARHKTFCSMACKRGVVTDPGHR